MLRLYVDECVDARIVAGLRRRGTDIVTAAEQGLLGDSDERHLAEATSLRRVLVTQDDDFLKLAHDVLEAGTDFPGLIYLSPATPVGEAIRGILLIVTVLEPDDMQQWIEWVP